MIISRSMNRLLWVNRDVTKVFSIVKSTKLRNYFIRIVADWYICIITNWFITLTLTNKSIIKGLCINNRTFIVTEYNSVACFCSSTEGRKCTSTKLMISYMLIRDCTTEGCFSRSWSYSRCN